MEDRKQEIDEWLDAGLKHYADAEPREGLEGRLLATVRAEQQRPSFGPARWIAIAAVLATAAALFLSRRTPAESHIPSTFSIPDVRSSNDLVTEPLRYGHGVAPKRRRKPKLPSVTSEPRLDQFPSPQPLSEQEEMLARYVRERRQEAVMVARARAELEDSKFLSGARQLPSIEFLPEPQQ
jgi:hypothetical protein